MDARSQPDGTASGVAGAAIPHDSATLHVSGGAYYTDDLPEPRDLCHLAVGISDRAHARIVDCDLEQVRSAPGVLAVVTAGDIPGKNNYGALFDDDPILAATTVEYAGQLVFLVVANDVESARKAARLATIEYEDLPAFLDAETAHRNESYVLPTQTLTRGNVKAALKKAAHRLSGRVVVGGQDQFYLEGQVAMAVPKEDGDLLIYSSTQHPGEVQQIAAHAIGVRAKDVIVECRRMGGGFGGKETQPALIASLAAIASRLTGRACKLRLCRDDDMVITGKRHDFVIDYDVGFDTRGLISGIEFEFQSRCGMSADLSGPINDRAMFHCDNAYFLEHVKIVSHRCKTHTVSNTAFRGFGGPQGMIAIESVIDDIARYLKKDSLEIRKLNFYGVKERNVTPYRQPVKDNIIGDIVGKLESSSAYAERRQSVIDFNRENRYQKRGLALTPVKFGISFTATHLNQAGALLHIYTDGTVHLNHGGTEMGQGLYTKVAQVVAEELQIDIGNIKITAADTSKVPNASATAASSGADLNGKAAQRAARKVKKRLIRFAARHFDVDESAVRFERNKVHAGDVVVDFPELIKLAWFARVGLSATGFYKTPKIRYDRETLTGRPFFYFAYGAAVSEVILDTLTGEHRVLRVDILHDCGRSLNPAIDMGQIEGGFVQGMGWLTTEQLWWDERGVLKTHAPSTYKIPVCSDVPAEFNVEMLESSANREKTIHRSKAVGEPPFMLAISVFQAIKDAVAATARGQQLNHVDLQAPATPEAVLTAINALASESPA